jgi:hypothetical protein
MFLFLSLPGATANSKNLELLVAAPGRACIAIALQLVTTGIHRFFHLLILNSGAVTL